MEDNDKRNSSVPSAPSDNSDSKPQDMFDPHEATLPRFTIDPGDAAPLRQRTRTLLGVPTLVTDEDAERASTPAVLPTPSTPPTPPASSESPEPTVVSGRLTSSILDGDTHLAPYAALSQALDSTHELDMTIDVVEDELNDVTMVSDADVVALPDSTGQLHPVRFDAELIAPAAIGSAAAASRREATISASAAAFASTAPNPNSLTPREISRAAVAPQPSREASSRWGALLVAAVMLLATGAWFLTAGTFRRATLSSSESTTAAATQPASNLPADKTEKVVPAVPAPAETPTPSVAEAATPTPATSAPPAPAQLAAAEDVAAPGPGLKNKPALTATVRGERVRRSSRSSKANAAPAPTGELPQGPTRAEVVTRLESVRPAVHACAAGRSGVADLDVTIAHTGLVMHVLVGGDFAGTTEGSCIARAVRQARFPAFKQERFRLLYPYAM